MTKTMSMSERVQVNAFVEPDNQLMRISSMIPDNDDEAPPMDIVCVIDISWSMGGSAACQTDGKTEYEDLGFSLMDLVKHAAKTVVKVLRPTDRVSIVLFDDVIEVPFDFTEMTDENREAVLKYVDGIQRRNSTNIYDAIIKAIDLVNEREGDHNKNDAAIMFFTDGQPNSGKETVTPLMIKGFNEYKTQKNFQFPIHTYAFGQYTNCTSDLLF